MISKPKSIFIVDDDEMLTMMLTDHLSRYPSFDIKAFATGEECLENLYLEPDIIILDFNLNSVDEKAANGLQILQKIKREIPSVKVIMYSSQEQYGIALQTIGKGAVEYVIKDKDAFFKIEEIIRNF
jgi:two-component system, OmpR family, response regulator